MPLVIFGSLSVSAGILSLRLPETVNTSLPKTIQDAENFPNCMSLIVQYLFYFHETLIESVVYIFVRIYIYMYLSKKFLIIVESLWSKLKEYFSHQIDIIHLFLAEVIILALFYTLILLLGFHVTHVTWHSGQEVANFDLDMGLKIWLNILFKIVFQIILERNNLM